MAETRFLVMNADDMGYSAERDRGIIECKEKSVISSASLMINGVHANEAIVMAKTADLPIGLHLNLTEGLPVGRRAYKTIVNNNRLFHGKFGFPVKLKAGHIDLNEVREEIVCQIERFQQIAGELPDHVDGHQHAHIYPGVCDLFAEVLQERGIHITRMPCEKNIEQCDWIAPPRMNFYKDIIRHGEECKKVYKKHGLQFTESFAGLSTSREDMTVERLTQAIKKSFSNQKSDTVDCQTLSMSEHIGQTIKTCEIMVHPGYPTGAVGGCGGGPDEYSQSNARKNEMDVLNHPEIKQYFKDNNIQLCSFKECFR